MVSKVILIENIFDVDMIPQNDYQNTNTKIFSFNFATHQLLESKKIPHEMADNLLHRDERFKLFDICFKFHSWFTNLPSIEYEFENVNLLKLVDSTGFQLFIMPNFINFVLIKRIIEKETPSKILSSKIFSETINSINKNNTIEIYLFQKLSKQEFLWDTIPIGFSIHKKNLSFNLSREKYFKVKNFVESTVNSLYNVEFNINNSKTKNILFLEFNVASFSKLFQELKNFDGNIILVNQRRPAAWNKTSLDIIRNSNCKILRLDQLLNKKDVIEISVFHKKFLKSIDKLWENSEFFSNLFQFEGIIFWNTIKDQLMKIYSDKLHYYIKLITGIKKFCNTVKPSCIVTLNETGETEKAFLEFGKNRFHTILLEHGFQDKNDFVSEMKRYDALGNYDKFNDKIAVWGEMKKKYLIENYGLDPKNIIVSGSPRHDNYFLSRKQKVSKKEKIILLAPNPISDTAGLSSTELKLKFNKFIKKLIPLIKKFDNVKLIVKLHPFPLKHNEEIKSLIENLDKNIPIHLSTPVIDLVNSADMVMVVSPEPGTTTMLLESMILGKPTMNIYFEEEVPQYNHVKHNAIFSVLDNCDLEKNLEKILFDIKFQKELIQNADNYVSKYLSNSGNASEKFAEILKSY